MKTEKIIQILIEDKNYDKVQTERLAAKIEALPEDIKSALVNWIENDTLESPEYSGYTVTRILAEKPNMTVVAAFLSLDWIRRDPKNALKAMKQIVMKRL